MPVLTPMNPTTKDVRCQPTPSVHLTTLILRAKCRRTPQKNDERSKKFCKKPNNSKEDSDGRIDPWDDVLRVHLEQDNLNDRQHCSVLL